jgi:crossover junction endodeoxyribonuclease RuvC
MIRTATTVALSEQRRPDAFCILGIDPGLSGALAFYFPSLPGLVTAEDLPIAGGEIDIATLAARLRQMRPDVAIIEQVASMPKQGVASTFKFGTAYGMARGLVTGLGIPVHLVTPRRWKTHFHLDSDKDKSRALALRYWPTSTAFARKKDDGRAEAALIARFGAEVLLGAQAA